MRGCAGCMGYDSVLTFLTSSFPELFSQSPFLTHGKMLVCRRLLWTGVQIYETFFLIARGVVTTGYHVDGPENLLIQVTGTKEVSLLKPSEKEKLQYEEVVDAEPQVDLTPNGEVQLGAVRNLHRRSRGHSLLDVAGSSAVPEEFLETYQEAQGISCQIHPGDVLYIPSGWHHAVFTVPDEHCVALSLNLWYHRPREEPTSTAKDTKVMASLEPLATFDVRRAVALEAPPGFSLLDGGEEEAVREHCTAAHARELSLTPSEPESQAERNADFLGRLHHFKNLFRMSATDHPVSVMIHKVGPMLILDDGPRLANRGVGVPPDAGIGLDHEQSLMLAELDPSLEMALGALGEETSSLASLAPELKNRLCVKNTFLDIDEGSDYESLGRAQSAPGRVDCDTPRSMISEADHLAHQTAQSGAEAVRQQLQEHIERAANAWSLIPYEPGDTSNELAARHWELLQCTSGKGNPGAVVEAVRSLFEIPPQPSRFGRAVEWRCGPYKILLGCDLVVMQSAEKCDPTDFASFKMLPDGSGALPSRDDRLDMYLENMMCDISKAVWGSPQGDGSSTWRVFNTADLPSPGDGEDFNAKQIHQHSQQLLHFLKQRCRRQGGTYWLFREANSSAAELFDLTEELTVENWDVDSSNSAFRTTPSLAPPIASLCAHLAQSMAQNEEKRQLLQKAVHLLEPLKEDHFGLYAMTALELACSYMRTPLAAISDKDASQQRPDPPPAARLSVALRYLESVLRLLGRLDESSLRAGLLLQAQVAYAECIMKFVREAAVPTYSAWLADVQNAKDLEKKGRTKHQLDEMKQLSAAFLLWRLFWLCRAHRAMSFLPAQKREVECWNLDRDLCELMGDALYGLSRYPADDVENLLAGQMSTAEGICSLVEEGLRTWVQGQDANQSSGKSKPEAGHGHVVGAVFLSKMNPLHRQVGDRALLEDVLVRDDLRKGLWSEGQAMHQCLVLYQRAVVRLRGDVADPATLKVARKLAHLYNEEARVALLDPSGAEKAEELLQQAQHWMVMSGDRSNAGRVLLNLSELHARRAERQTDSGPFTEAQYQEFLRCAECCEEAASLSNGTIGRREGAFAHLRLAVHLLVRVPTQVTLGRRPLSELSDRHLGKALRLFDELKDEREVAVCHFYMADLALQEQSIPGAPPLSKARLTSAQRHAKRSADYWERKGALEYAKDLISSHVRVARLLACRPAAQEAIFHLASVETKLLGLARERPKADRSMDEGLVKDTTVPSLRREMASICQAGIRQGEDIERLKVLYRQVLRNEKICDQAGSQS
ncbi:Erythroid differentiation-related factor 1 [Durusdinium trenchii]|uniref:Erythroid differentiation-related factor 1 n=1 Tax=Durusdinium trenchii TaxID=1381693 RepID=A0ABP0IZC2_9DINO